MISLLTELEPAKIGGHRIDVVQRRFHGKTVNLIKKGGHTMGDKGGKKDKDKAQKQKASQQTKKDKKK